MILVFVINIDFYNKKCFIFIFVLSSKISQFEEKVEKLQKFLDIIVEPTKWPLKKVETLLSVSGEYSVYFQDEKIFRKYEIFIRKYMNPTEQAKEMQEFMLKVVLQKHVNREVVISVYQTYVNMIPDGKEKAKKIISNHIRTIAIGNILETKASKAFLPYVIASEMLDNNNISKEIKEEDLAKAAIIALRKDASLLPMVKDIILKNFEILNIDSIVNASLASEETMKVVLSKVVIMIVKNERRQFGIEILQKLATFPKGKPAITIAKAIQKKHNIHVILD